MRSVSWELEGNSVYVASALKHSRLAKQIPCHFTQRTGTILQINMDRDSPPPPEEASPQNGHFKVDLCTGQHPASKQERSRFHRPNPSDKSKGSLTKNFRKEPRGILDGLLEPFRAGGGGNVSPDLLHFLPTIAICDEGCLEEERRVAPPQLVNMAHSASTSGIGLLICPRSNITPPKATTLTLGQAEALRQRDSGDAAEYVPKWESGPLKKERFAVGVPANQLTTGYPCNIAFPVPHFEHRCVAAWSSPVEEQVA